MVMIVPKHYTSAANAISKTAVHRMDSDDFATPKDVQIQLDQLQEYIDDRQFEQEDYKLPQPSGWKLMILTLTIPEKSHGGVFVVDDAKEARSLGSPQGVVLAVGPGAYQDRDRFEVDDKIQPWHLVGDRITFVKYDAVMFQIANGQRLGFLNDTQPVSTIDKDWTVPC